MKNKILTTATLVLVSTTFVGCFSNTNHEQVAEMDYTGTYEVFSNGRCKLAPINHGVENMVLEIGKTTVPGAYTLTIPSFNGTSIPSVSSSSVMKANSITFDFAPKTTTTDGKELTVSASLQLKPEEDRLVLTEFTLNRATPDVEESRDMVAWYIDNIKDPTINKEQLAGLCVKKLEG